MVKRKKQSLIISFKILWIWKLDTFCNLSIAKFLQLKTQNVHIDERLIIVH